MFTGGFPAADLGPSAGPPLTPFHTATALSSHHQHQHQQHYQQQAQHQHQHQQLLQAHLLPGHGPAATAAAPAAPAVGVGVGVSGFPTSRAGSGAVSAHGYHYVHPSSLHPATVNGMGAAGGGGTGHGMGMGTCGGAATHTAGFSRASSFLDCLPSGPTTADVDDEIMQCLETDLFEGEAAAAATGGSVRLAGRGGGGGGGRNFRSSLHGGGIRVSGGGGLGLGAGVGGGGGGGGGGGTVSMVLPGAAGPHGAGGGALFLSSGPHPAGPGPAYGGSHHQQHQHHPHQHQHPAYAAAAVAGLVPGFSRLPDLPEQDAGSDTDTGGGKQRQRQLQPLQPLQPPQSAHIVSVERLVDRVTAVNVSGLGAKPAAAAAATGPAVAAAAAAAAPWMRRVDSEAPMDVSSALPQPGDGAVPFPVVHVHAGGQSLFTGNAAGAAAAAAAASSSRMPPGVSSSAAAAIQSYETSLAGAYHHTHIQAQLGSGDRRRHMPDAEPAYTMCLSGSGRCGSVTVTHCPDCSSGGPFAEHADIASASAAPPPAPPPLHPALGASLAGGGGIAVADALACLNSDSGYHIVAGEMAPRALGWSVSCDHATPLAMQRAGAVAVHMGAVPYVGSFGPTSAASIAAAAGTPPWAGGGGSAATTGGGAAGTSLGLPGFASGPISGSIAAAACRSVGAFAPPRSLAAPSASGGGGGGSFATVDPRLQLPNTHAGWVGGGGGSASAMALPPQLYDNLPDDGVAGSTLVSGCLTHQLGRNSISTNGTSGTPRLAKVASPSASAFAAAAAGGAAAGYGDTAAAAASGLPQDGEKVAAAVRALLRFDLPFHPSQPPVDHDTASTAAAAAAGRSPGGRTADADADGAAADAAYAPELPPPGPLPEMPLPASLLAALEPSGVVAVDGYLQQLLLDPSPDRHVFLCKRLLGPAACRAIASFLALCPGAVRSITLSHCGITCDGLAALCEGLRSCRQLLVLDLSYNALADMGAAALSACLSDMPALASLTLAGNAELGDAGVAALAAAARGCLALRRVGLRGTAATALGMKDLASSLASNLRRAVMRRGVPSPPRGPLTAHDRPVTWDGTGGSAGGVAGGGHAADVVFIGQLCSLLRTLVQPALPAEQAVAEAVAELLAEAPMQLAARQPHDGVAAAAAARHMSSAVNSGGSGGASISGQRVLQGLHASEQMGPPQSVSKSSADAEGQPAAPAAAAAAGAATTAVRAAAPEGRFSNSNESAAATAAGSGTGNHSASSSAGSGSITTIGAASTSTAAGAAAGDSDLLAYLAEGLTARGYDVAVTHALGGGSGGECLRNLRHTFLSVTVPLPPGLMPSGPPSPAAAAVAAASLARSATAASTGSNAAAAASLAGTLNRRRHSIAYGAVGAAAPPAGAAASGFPGLPYHPGVIIVDPELREQFELAMPTPRYDALVAALPRVYVGAEERLPLVVEVLCDELALALRSKGLIIPPWRESSAMISKWQPKLSKLLVPGTPGYAQQMQQHQQGSRRQSRDGGGANGGGSGRSSACATPRVSLAGGIAFGFGGAAAAAAGGAAAAAMPVPVLWRTIDPRSAASSHRMSRSTTAAGGAGGAPGDASASGGYDEPSLGPAGHALGSIGSEGSAALRQGAAGSGVGNGNGAADSLSGSLRRVDSSGCGGYGGGASAAGNGGGGGSSAVSSAVHSFGFRRCTSSNSLLSSSVGLTPASATGGGVGAGGGGGIRAAVNSRLVTGAAAALLGPQALATGGGGGGVTGSGRALWLGGGGGGLSPVPHSPTSPSRCA